MSSEEVHEFHATNGRVMGYLGLIVCVVVAVAAVVTAGAHTAVTVVLGCALFAALFWAALLRPRVWATGDRLRIRNMFEEVTIPLGAIESAVVRRFLVVRAGGNRYICPAISRPLRRTVDADMSFRRSPLRAPEVKGEHDMYYPDFVEQQIVRLAREDRMRRGVEERSEEEYALADGAHRALAWPEIAGVLVLGLAFVAALVV